MAVYEVSLIQKGKRVRIDKAKSALLLTKQFRIDFHNKLMLTLKLLLLLK